MGDFRKSSAVASQRPSYHIIQETTSDTEKSHKVEHKVVASLDVAHGVHEVNAIAWCPRAGMEGIFATAGDDGHVKVWKLDIKP